MTIYSIFKLLFFLYAIRSCFLSQSPTFNVCRLRRADC